MSFNTFLNLYKKTERLGSAVFLVSESVMGAEELKTKIKQLVISLISNCVEIKDSNTSEKIKLLSKMESILLEITSLFDIASVSGLVSSMNASILKQEFDSIIKNINELKNYYSNSKEISSNFFHSFEAITEPVLIISPDPIKDKNIPQKDKNNRKER